MAAHTSGYFVLDDSDDLSISSAAISGDHEGGRQHNPRLMHELRIDVDSDSNASSMDDDERSVESAGLDDDQHTNSSALQPPQSRVRIAWWYSRSIPPYCTKRVVGACLFDSTVFLCLAAFVFQARVEVTKFHADNSEDGANWTLACVPLFITSGLCLCERLFQLILLNVYEVSEVVQSSSENVVAYGCVAWGCSLFSVFLVWLRLIGVLTLLPLTFLLTPLWVLAFFGSLLLYFASPPRSIASQGPAIVEAFEAEVQVGARLNVWIFGLQGICIALKLDNVLGVDWARILLPTTLLLIVAGVVLVPYALGILWSGTCALLSEGMSRNLLALFGVASMPLIIGSVVVFLGLAFISQFALAMDNSKGEEHLHQHVAESLVPLLQMFISLSFLLPVKRILDERDTYYEEQLALQRQESEEMARLPQTPKLQPLDSPVVLLRQGGEYFRMASLSVRRKFRHTPKKSDECEAEGLLLRTLEGKECFVCISEHANAVIIPCGHGGLCYDCATSIVRGAAEHRCCPICRGPIEKVVQLPKRAVHWGSQEVVRTAKGVYVSFEQPDQDANGTEQQARQLRSDSQAMLHEV